MGKFRLNSEIGKRGARKAFENNAKDLFKVNIFSSRYIFSLNWQVSGTTEN